jgi:hypothetical protein
VIAPVAEAIDGTDPQLLARDMIEVHGTEAATIARDNARAAAIAAQILQAKRWIKVLASIQRLQAAGLPAG